MDLTLASVCSRHTGAEAVGRCDRCGKSFCEQCRIDEIAAEKQFCSVECRNLDRSMSGNGVDAIDDRLINGYGQPIEVGSKTWLLSFPTLVRRLSPLALLVMVATAAWGMAFGEVWPDNFGQLATIFVLLGLYGVALVGVVLSGVHTGHVVDSPYLHTLRRFVPWLITWSLVVGATLLGYLLLVIPGIYVNLRLFWADEFALIHRTGPFKALDQSWRISRGEVGRTFLAEMLLSFAALPAMLVAIAAVVFVGWAANKVTGSHVVVASLTAGAATLSLLLAYAFLHASQIALFYGLRSSFRKEGATATAARPTSWVLKALAVPAAVLVFALIGLSILMETGLVPSERVVAGEDVSSAHYDLLVSEGVIADGETIEYFYSEGLFSILAGGSLLTDRSVIAYERSDDDELQVWYLDHADIGFVEQTQQGDTLNFSVHTLHSHDRDEWLELWLPHEHGDDRKFIDAVKAKIESVQSNTTSETDN